MGEQTVGCQSCFWYNVAALGETDTMRWCGFAFRLIGAGRYAAGCTDYLPAEVQVENVIEGD